MTDTIQNQTDTPAAGVYQIDPTHSAINLTIKHLVVAKVRGRFLDFSGSITIDGDQGAESSALIEIATSSIDTGNSDRDEHLRSVDFFDIERFPTATFESSKVTATGGGHDLSGRLTIAGVTEEVVLALTFDGEAIDPWGNTRAVFSATTDIDRETFGLTWNQTLETGGVMVGKTARVDIDIEAVKQEGSA